MRNVMGECEGCGRPIDGGSGSSFCRACDVEVREDLAAAAAAVEFWKRRWRGLEDRRKQAGRGCCRKAEIDKEKEESELGGM
ncbi:hypothetical protein CMI37_16210 [Candidatus Pacearchaeota archaeon]|nr:hypothetical protein [Candidatus Pacearchaeota archaeon]